MKILSENEKPHNFNDSTSRVMSNEHKKDGRTDIITNASTLQQINDKYLKS